MEELSAYEEAVPKPVAIILDNRARLAQKLGVETVDHTPPSMDHYPHIYPWDKAATIKILTHFGYLREAEMEVFSLFAFQRQNGMVPNMQRIPGFRRADPELLTFTRPQEAADYSQPPIWGQAIASLYGAKRQQNPKEARLFLKEVIKPTIRSLDYFINHRRAAPDNPLIFNLVPQETGRDSDESLNGYAPKLPSRGLDTPYVVELVNTATDYFGKLALGGLNRLNGWDPKKVQRYYRPIDPMFVSIYADNLRIVGDLAAEVEDCASAERLHGEAAAVEARIISDLFVPEANDGKGAFLVDNKGPQAEISISSLGPLLLETLPTAQLKSILELMDDHFDAPYPLPTMSVQSQHYDPEGRRLHRVWTGEVMMIANWLICLGLRKQAARAEKLGRPDLATRCLDWSETRILAKSKQLLQKGYYEGFSSQTGRPRRTKTVPGNFVWDGLIETL